MLELILKYKYLMMIPILGSWIQLSWSFPDGAPEETCFRHKPNHGEKPQPLDTLPFIIEATGSTYKHGESIAVHIVGKKDIYFKGFFIQAVDDNGRWIGSFDETPFSVSHPECSATTHSENREKQEMTVIWRPPEHSKGKVHFLVSIIRSYKLYWVDAVAKTPQEDYDDST